jgi:predicted nucleic acid-binding protein
LIAADTNVWIAYLKAERARDTVLLDEALARKAVQMVPVVLAELFSDPDLGNSDIGRLIRLPLVEITAGYWERAGRLRADMFVRRYRPKLMDTLIAQACLDHDLHLLTRDTGFPLFAKHAGLRLL